MSRRNERIFGDSADTSPSSNPAGGPLPADTVEAVQRALSTEHAAVWAYGLSTPFLTGSATTAGHQFAAAHIAQRDTTERVLRDSGAKPVPPEPSYVPPQKVDDQPSAIALLISAESDTVAAWRSVLEHTDDAGLRRSALDSMTAAAVRDTRWRQRINQTPYTVPLPGQ